MEVKSSFDFDVSNISFPYEDVIFISGFICMEEQSSSHRADDVKKSIVVNIKKSFFII